MNRPTTNNPRAQTGSHDASLRVSQSWPARTKDALRVSLDHGTFEDICLAVYSGPELAMYPVYFAGVVDERVGSPISCRKCSNYHRNKLTTSAEVASQIVGRSLRSSTTPKYLF